MTLNNIIEELKEVPEDRWDEVYQFLHSLKLFSNSPNYNQRNNNKTNLEFAVNELYTAYSTDDELTIFTKLDTEEFYETK